jgi:hypothetical protein
MMGEDARTDATVEQEELARAHGQNILDAASEATQGRAEQDRALLDAIGRASEALAKGEDSDG